MVEDTVMDMDQEAMVEVMEEAAADLALGWVFFFTPPFSFYDVVTDSLPCTTFSFVNFSSALG
jgi:hypothetical protein